MPIFGFTFGGLFGDYRPSNIRSVPHGHGVWTVTVTPDSDYPSPCAFIIALNGKHYASLPGSSQSDFSFSIKTYSNSVRTPIVEVIQTQIETLDAGFFPDGFFTSVQPSQLIVTWTPPAVVSDVFGYNIYWDKGEGTVQYTDDYLLQYVQETGETQYTYATDDVDSGTYKTVVRTIDSSGNESNNTTAATTSVSTYPSVATGVNISYSNSTHKATITWTDPSDIGAGNIRIYHNSGDADKPYADYGTIIDTVSAATETWESPVLTEGYWVFGLRAYNGSVEELNTAIMERVRIDASLNAVVGYPPSPILAVSTSVGGKVRLTAYVNSFLAGGFASTVQFFTNDGAGGAVDYGTPLGTGYYGLTSAGEMRYVEFETSAYGETSRIFGAKCYTEGGTESNNAQEMTIIPNATLPPQPGSQSTVAGRL